MRGDLVRLLFIGGPRPHLRESVVRMSTLEGLAARFRALDSLEVLVMRKDQKAIRRRLGSIAAEVSK